MPTIRNARGADIFIASPEGKKLGVQVKSLSGNANAFIGKNYADPSVDFWIVLLNVRASSEPAARIVPAKAVRDSGKACQRGDDARGKLVHNGRGRPDGSVTTCSSNAKSFDSPNHTYAEARESIRAPT